MGSSLLADKNAEPVIIAGVSAGVETRTDRQPATGELLHGLPGARRSTSLAAYRPRANRSYSIARLVIAQTDIKSPETVAFHDATAAVPNGNPSGSYAPFMLQIHAPRPERVVRSEGDRRGRETQPQFN